MKYTKKKVKETEPIISIITPFFNAEEYIEETAIMIRGINTIQPLFEASCLPFSAPFL